jgi:CRP/FNR family transcriptional regulator, cyclic AMP receptor protein
VAKCGFASAQNCCFSQCWVSVSLFLFLKMTPQDIRKVPLFESFDDDDAQRLCERLETRDVDAQKILFRAGDVGDAMYLIEDGRVRISVQTSDGREITLTELGRRDFFGEMALLDGQPRSANATTIMPSRLAVLSREHLLSLMAENPKFALELLTAMGNRLRRTDELLRRLATRNVNVEEAAHLTLADRAADIMAEFGGSWKFIIVAVVLFNAWMWVNTWLLGTKGFDPFPYILLNLVLNMITAIQAPIIMMSQNRQSHKDRLRADLDYQVNLKNELSLQEILQRLKILEKDRMPLTGENLQGDDQ